MESPAITSSLLPYVQTAWKDLRYLSKTMAKIEAIHCAIREGLKLTQSGKVRGGTEERSAWKRTLP